MLPRFIEQTGVLVQPCQGKLDVGVARHGLGQILVSLDRLGIVLHDSRVDGEDQVPFLGGKLFGESHGLARGRFGIAVVPQVGLHLAQPRVCQRELRIILRRGLKFLQRLKILTPTRELKPLVVIAQGLEGIGRRLPGLRLKLLHNVGG